MTSGPDDAQLMSLASQLGELLRQRGWSLCTAESCTGGWLAKVITDIAGSSQWFERGFVTYTNQSKQDLLGLSAQQLAAEGAVSAATVEAMAQEALRQSPAQLSCAISGIAGPGGGSAAKPVGLVWFAWAQRAPAATPTRVHAVACQFAGDREAVRRQAVAYALQGLLDASR